MVNWLQKRFPTIFRSAPLRDPLAERGENMAAKYLRNLDPNSAYYDPKTRAMRKNPYEGTGRGDDEVDYAGDNFVRISGDTVDHAKSQLFAWEAEEEVVVQLPGGSGPHFDRVPAPLLGLALT